MGKGMEKDRIMQLRLFSKILGYPVISNLSTFANCLHTVIFTRASSGSL